MSYKTQVEQTPQTSGEYTNPLTGETFSFFAPTGKISGPPPVPYRDDWVDPDESDVFAISDAIPESIRRSVDTQMRDSTVPNPASQYEMAFDPRSDVWSLNSAQAENIENSGGPVVFESSPDYGRWAVAGLIVYFTYALLRGRFL